MVGNILGISGASDDQGAAARAGWRFIQERDSPTGGDERGASLANDRGSGRRGSARRSRRS